MSAVTPPSPLAGRTIRRMNGAGNTILVLDLRGERFTPTPAEARAIHRARGLDYDQMMVLSDPGDARSAASVRIYNNDGSLAGACGNGIRCVADLLCGETGRDALTVETEAGLIACERLGVATYRADMGPPRLAWDEIPLSEPVEDTRRVALPCPGAPELPPAAVVNMGNPHAIFFVPDLARVDVPGLGARFEVHPMFPEKANVTFAEVTAHDAVVARVWERGVGLTLACGSAACATVVAASRLGLTARSARVKLPGGELTIEWRPSDGHVLMTGPVAFERSITLDAALFEERATAEAAPP